MNSSNLTNGNKKEKIFLCRKIKRLNNQKEPIFYIEKIKKIGKEIEQFDLNLTYDSTIEIENKKIPSIYEIKIPSFFNDIIMKKEKQVQQKLRKYSEASIQFNDIEDAEVYLIKIESLFSEKE